MPAKRRDFLRNKIKPLSALKLLARETVESIYSLLFAAQNETSRPPREELESVVALTDLLRRKGNSSVCRKMVLEVGKPPQRLPLQAGRHFPTPS